MINIVMTHSWTLVFHEMGVRAGGTQNGRFFFVTHTPLHRYSLVAAAAFVPSSFTTILAFWSALDTYTGSAPEEIRNYRTQLCELWNTTFNGLIWKTLLPVYLREGQVETHLLPFTTLQSAATFPSGTIEKQNWKPCKRLESFLK